MNEIRKHVESILNSYPDMKQQLKALRYEMDILQKTLDPGMIEDKVFAHSGGERVSSSQPRNQTADIVIEHVDGQRDARYHALKSIMYTMGLEVRRLEHHLALLPKEEADIIRWFYFDGLSWASIAKKTSLTIRSAQRRRKCGLDGLVNFYSVTDDLPLRADDARMKARFISYLHEERYSQCLERMEGTMRTPGTDAMLYIISGCNEFWNAGVDAFVNFETWELIPQEDMTESFSVQGAKLLRLAYCFAHEVAVERLPNVINGYFPGLEYVHLELAIEAMRIALFPILQ
jgi:hypothetical protein